MSKKSSTKSRIIFWGIMAAGIYGVTKFIKKQKNRLLPNFQGEQYMYSFADKNIVKGEGENVNNMRLINSFSNMSVDISKAEITSDVSIELDNVFSNVMLAVPEGINVKVDCSGKGSIVTPETSYEEVPTIYISGKNHYSSLNVFVKNE